MAEIETAVPIPAPRGGVSIYPFAALNVGESFYVRLDKKASVQALATRHSKNGKRFTTRKMGEEIRVWRVK